jgi:NAD(P)H-flavin reductase
MTVRDSNDSPLTILQSQKQIWNSVKKIDKKDILKEISNSNVFSVTDIQSLGENVSIKKTIKTVAAVDYYHTSQFSNCCSSKLLLCRKCQR